MVVHRNGDEELSSASRQVVRQLAAFAAEEKQLASAAHGVDRGTPQRTGDQEGHGLWASVATSPGTLSKPGLHPVSLLRSEVQRNGRREAYSLLQGKAATHIGELVGN